MSQIKVHELVGGQRRAVDDGHSGRTSTIRCAEVKVHIG
jgi:hypothetical protein